MEYKTIITTAGAEKIADCILRGEQLNISSAAAGDGGGAPYIPSADQTALVNERWRGEIASAGVNPNEPNMLDVKVVIHSTDTEFIVRELGLYDDDGTLIAVTNTPETQKALPENGASNKLTFIIHLVVADGSAVSFTINSTLSGVTAEEMNAAIAEVTPVGAFATIPADAWSNDADIARDVRTNRVAYRSTGAIDGMILTSADVTDEWSEFSGSFVYDNSDSNQLILRFFGGPKAAFIQSYDIANVRIYLASDADKVNVLPDDIADLNWGMASDDTSNKLCVSFEDGLKYVHVFRQTGNTVKAAAFTGINLVQGETYVLSCCMRSRPLQYTAIVPVDGIRAASSTIVTPCADSAVIAFSCGVRAFGQRIGELMFTADTVPSEDLTASVAATCGEGGAILNCAPSYTKGRITPSDIGAAPAYTYGTEDLEAGVSALATGKLHFVYE